MRRPALFAAAAILTVIGAAVAMKLFVAATSATAAHHAVVASARVATPVSESGMMAIVPAPVIDTKAEVFIGTGDASGGDWVKR